MNVTCNRLISGQGLEVSAIGLGAMGMSMSYGPLEHRASARHADSFEALLLARAAPRALVGLRRASLFPSDPDAHSKRTRSASTFTLAARAASAALCDDLLLDPT